MDRDLPALSITLSEAEGFIDLGMLDEASNLLDALCDRDQIFAPVLELRLRILAAVELWDSVLQLTAGLLEQDFSDWFLFLYGARALRRLGKTDAARALLLAETLKKPILKKTAEAYFELASLEAEFGNEEEARSCLAAALALDPEYRAAARNDEDLRPLLDLVVQVDSEAEPPPPTPRF